MSRTEIFLTAVDFLQSGRNVRIIGERLSGSTHLLNRIRDHFVTLGWRTITVTGMEALRGSDFGSMALAGLMPWAEQRASSATRAFRALSEQILAHRTVILLDDVEWIDEATWGVISAVSRQGSVPVALTRSMHRFTGGSLPIGGVGPFYSLHLPSMSYGELEDAVETRLGRRIEPGTMSRLFSKAGGNVGAAFTILESATHTGRINSEDGQLRAVDSLWSSALESIVEELLQGVDAEEIIALRTLALLGPVNLRTAERLVAPTMIFELEEKRFLDIVDMHDGPFVSVFPPLVAEYFRHESAPGRRSDALRRIDSSLEVSLDLEPHDLHDPTATALFVRVAHGYTRRATLAAREVWRKTPSLISAARLLGALGADAAHSADETTAIIVAAARLDGDPHARAEWEVARARYEAHHQGLWTQSIARLQAVASSCPPSTATRLEAEAFVLALGLSSIPDEDPFAGVSLHSLEDHARTPVLLARAAWLLTRGKVIDADALLTAHHAIDSPDPRLHAAVVYGKLGLGEFTAAADIAMQKSGDAHQAFDASRVRAAQYLVALASIFTRDFSSAESAIDTANALGVPMGETPASTIGLNVLGAYFSAKRGQRGVAVARLAEIDAAGFSDGALPGLHRSFARTRLAILDGDLELARTIAREAGDELWERGAVFAAAFAYLDGLRINPTVEDWDHAKDRLTVTDSPAIARWTSFTRALIMRDVEGIVAAIAAVEGAGQAADAAEFARIARRALVNEPGVTPEAWEAIDRVAATDRRAAPGGFVELTARELEVAELVASGLSNPMIAEALVVSVRTVESHVNKLIKKIGAQSRSDIRNYLIEAGMR